MLDMMGLALVLTVLVPVHVQALAVLREDDMDQTGIKEDNAARVHHNITMHWHGNFEFS